MHLSALCFWVELMPRCYILKVYSFLLFVLKGLNISWHSNLGPPDLVLHIHQSCWSLRGKICLLEVGWFFSGCGCIIPGFPHLFFISFNVFLIYKLIFFPFYLQSLISLKLLARCSQIQADTWDGLGTILRHVSNTRIQCNCSRGDKKILSWCLCP